jgi:FkbM family methyltransferase
MNRYVQKIKTLKRRIYTIITMLCNPAISLSDTFSYIVVQIRYAMGQVIASTPLSGKISFATKFYKLYLTKSPVAMVFFGDPHHTRFEDDVARALLKEGDICVDAGVNIGTFTLSAAKSVGKTGHVYAFEAHPRTAEYARRNLALNHVSNVTLEQKALGDKEMDVYISNDVHHDDINHVAISGIKVEGITLNGYAPLTTIKEVALLKVDVEGYELFLLNGATDVLAKTKYVLFEAYEENCSTFNYSVSDLFSWFHSHNFVTVSYPSYKKIEAKDLSSSLLENVLAVRGDVYEKVMESRGV